MCRCEAIGLLGRRKLPKGFGVEIIRKVTIAEGFHFFRAGFAGVIYPTDKKALCLGCPHPVEGILKDGCSGAVPAQSLHGSAENQ